MKRIGLVKKRFLKKEKISTIIDSLTTNGKRKDWCHRTRKLWEELLEKRDLNIDIIYNKLNNLTWIPGSFNVFEKKEGKKIRKIYESEPRDLIVDTLWFECLMYVFFEKKKIVPENCYGSIKNKGQHELRKKIIDLVHYKPRLYVYIGDTKQYYPTMSHEILYNTFALHIKDKWLLWLCKVCIDRMPGDTGVALGVPSSNPIGHIYHSVIDWYIALTLKCKRYYRFCDDKWIFHTDKNYLHTVAREISSLTNKDLNLIIKKNWRIVNCKNERFECLGAMINSHGARLRTFSRRRIESHIKKCIKKGDPQATLRTWSGIKGSLKDLHVSNLIKYWKKNYPEFFDLIDTAMKKVLLNRKLRKANKITKQIFMSNSKTNKNLCKNGFVIA